MENALYDFFYSLVELYQKLTRLLCSLIRFLILLNSWIKAIYTHFPWSNLYLTSCTSLLTNIYLDTLRTKFITGMWFPYLWHTFKSEKNDFPYTGKLTSLFCIYLHILKPFSFITKISHPAVKSYITNKNLRQNSPKTNITHRDEASAHVSINYTKCSFIYGLQQIRAKVTWRWKHRKICQSHIRAQH